jgi:hypothetical protein
VYYRNHCICLILYSNSCVNVITHFIHLSSSLYCILTSRNSRTASRSIELQVVRVQCISFGFSLALIYCRDLGLLDIRQLPISALGLFKSVGGSIPSIRGSSECPSTPTSSTSLPIPTDPSYRPQDRRRYKIGLQRWDSSELHWIRKFAYRQQGTRS